MTKAHVLSESEVCDLIDVEQLGLSLVDREFNTDLGRIDILAVDPSGNYVPIEVKLGEALDNSIGQLLGYMQAIKSSRGIIVAAEFSKRVVATSKNLNIDLVPYVLSTMPAVVSGKVVICVADVVENHSAQNGTTPIRVSGKVKEVLQHIQEKYGHTSMDSVIRSLSHYETSIGAIISRGCEKQ